MATVAEDLMLSEQVKKTNTLYLYVLEGKGQFGSMRNEWFGSPHFKTVLSRYNPGVIYYKYK